MLIKVKVYPDSHREKQEFVEPDKLLLWVREPAENNLANLRVVKMVAEHFGVPTGRVRILNGHHKSSKIVEVVE
jgi:uncharacterized protein YggU (UPF0235/DUF167 family)